MSEVIRVVHKSRYDEQTYLSVTVPAQPLQETSVRAKVQLIGLSNNNLSYCLAGSVLHWWDAYPIPQTVPAPYYNLNEYGVAPGWGFAIVVDSTIQSIPKGRIIYGFVPISSHTVDLALKPSEVANQWIEVSPHRNRVMSMYQRYDVMPEGFDIDSPKAAWTAMLIRCEAGMVLSKYVFSQNGGKPIHPFGPQISPWTQKEANLTGACFVAIASGTKTAKAFIWHLASTARHIMPDYSLVEVTSGEGCKRFLKNIPFDHKIVPYESISLPNTFSQYSKHILLNFGGRANAFEDVYNAIRNSQQDAEVICVQIGSEPKVGTPESVKKDQALRARIKALQMNTTAIRDEAVAALGEKKYFADLNREFKNLVDEQISSFNGRVLGLDLKSSEGLQTESGIDGIWKRLTQAQVSTSEAIAVRI